MIPPEWIREASTRLNLEEFQSQFASAWSQLTARFLKVECWQEYQELETTGSQEAYKRGDISSARRLLKREAEGDHPLYEDIRNRQIDYARIRLLKLPLTDYLKYEIMAYSIRSEIGENIEILQLHPRTIVPSETHFDFLLFDRHTALIHDYGSAPTGAQSGGWISYDTNVVSALGSVAKRWREHDLGCHRSRPVAGWMAGPQPDVVFAWLRPFPGNGDGAGRWRGPPRRAFRVTRARG